MRVMSVCARDQRIITYLTSLEVETPARLVYLSHLYVLFVLSASTLSDSLVLLLFFPILEYLKTAFNVLFY